MIKKYSPRVPSAYKEVEYIESDGTQYIDTGIIPTNEKETTVTFEFKLSDISSGENQSMGSNSNLNFYAASDITTFRSNGVILPSLDTNWHIVSMSKNSSGKYTIFDGTTYSTTGTSAQSLFFYLFALNTDNTSSGKKAGRYALKETKIYENGIMVRDFIPVYHKTSGAIGMYDTVNSRFYENKGTGVFTKGSDVDNWITIPYRKYETATDTFTTLPHEVIGDGTALSAWSMKGNMQQSGTPTPTTPIYPQEVGEETANLFDKSTMYVTNYYLNASDGQYQKTSSATLCTIIVPVEPSVSYTITISSYTKRIGFFANYPNEADYPESYTNRSTGSYTTSTITLTAPSTANYLVVYCYSSTERTAGYTIDDVISNIMLNEGETAKTYEPYGYKIPILSNGVAYPIYLSEPIRKIGDYTDTINSDGTVSRRIAKLTFNGDGSVTWNKSTTYQGSFYAYNALVGGLNLWTPLICTHATWVYPIDVSHYVYGTCGADGSPPNPNLNLFIGQADWTVTQFNQFLAENPVTVYYVLATATTESFTAPTLPTSGSPQTFDVDTSLKPSEVSLTYHGWHEHSDTKFTTP